MDKLNFEFVFAESDNMYTCEQYSITASNDPEFEYNCRRNIIGYAKNSYYSFYGTREDNELIGEKGKVFLNDKYVNSFLLDSQKTRKSLDKFYLKILKTNLKEISNKQLSKLLDEYLVLFYRVHRLFMASQYEPLVYVEKKLKGLILIEKPKKELAGIFSTLVTSAEFDLIKREELKFA